MLFSRVARNSQMTNYSKIQADWKVDWPTILILESFYVRIKLYYVWPRRTYNKGDVPTVVLNLPPTVDGPALL
jgi:hypothetical protein